MGSLPLKHSTLRSMSALSGLVRRAVGAGRHARASGVLKVQIADQERMFMVFGRDSLLQRREQEACRFNVAFVPRRLPSLRRRT